MKAKRKSSRKPEAVKAIERISDLADAFANASPEKQQAALEILSKEIEAEKNRTSKNWLMLFRTTFEFLQTEVEEKITVNEIPIVDARRETKRTVSFYCEFCRERHTHGTAPGHRIAHCRDENSPYKKTGYNLRISGESPVEAE